MKPSEVNEDLIRTLADVSGISIPAEDLKPLVAAFKTHLTGMLDLDALDITEHDPIVTFDPSWAGEP